MLHGQVNSYLVVYKYEKAETKKSEVTFSVVVSAWYELSDSIDAHMKGRHNLKPGEFTVLSITKIS